MTGKRMEAVIKAMELAMEEQRVMTVINLDMKPIAQAAISADPVTEDVKRLVVCIGKIADSPDEENEWDAVEKYKSIRLLAQNELKKWSGE